MVIRDPVTKRLIRVFLYVQHACRNNSVMHSATLTLTLTQMSLAYYLLMVKNGVMRMMSVKGS